ncbi:hypothetical protein R6Q57_021322, partial [Mikania cordata]
NFLVQLQQNLNIQHFQQHPPNFQPPPNFEPDFAPYSQPRFESDFVPPSQPDNEVLPETQDTQKRKMGNSQKREKFWKKITVTWYNVMGFDAEYRSYLQLNSKWKDMCTKLTKFSVIYSNCANNKKNELSDENVLKWAEKEYQLKSNGQTFNHYHVWVAIKDSPKFRVLCQEGYEVQGSSKRTKTPNRTSIRRGVRPHIQITRLTSRMTKKKPNSTPHRNW